MNIALYLGTFRPWHSGHQDVLDKALKLFDKVIVMQLTNPAKKGGHRLIYADIKNGKWMKKEGKIRVITQKNVSALVAITNYIQNEDSEINKYALIRGLRNERDFCEEQILNYWYEDMGIKLPILYVISDRKLVHISSSTVKMVNKFKGAK